MNVRVRLRAPIKPLSFFKRALPAAPARRAHFHTQPLSLRVSVPLQSGYTLRWLLLIPLVERGMSVAGEHSVALPDEGRHAFPGVRAGEQPGQGGLFGGERHFKGHP